MTKLDLERLKELHRKSHDLTLAPDMRYAAAVDFKYVWRISFDAVVARLEAASECANAADAYELECLSRGRPALSTRTRYAHALMEWRKIRDGSTT